LGRAFKNTQAV